MTGSAKFVLKKMKDIVPYANNSRTHSDEQIAQIAASIQEFGFTNPILITDENVIIAGHGRVLAARKLKMGVIPAMVITGLTKTQHRALVIADNRLALSAGWDMEMLALEMRALMDDDYDLALTGFDEDEIDGFINGAGESDMPALDDSEDHEFQQMTFTLSNDQAETVKDAIKRAIDMGEFVDTDNDNGNGNALARICEMFRQIDAKVFKGKRKNARR